MTRPQLVDMPSPLLIAPRPRDVSRHDKGFPDLAAEAAKHDAHMFLLCVPQRVAGGDPIPLGDLIFDGHPPSTLRVVEVVLECSLDLLGARHPPTPVRGLRRTWSEAKTSS